MALINCPVCGEKVSDKAAKCIHCGSAIVTNKMDNNTQSLNQSGTLIGDNAITSQPTLINSSDTQNAQDVIKKFKKNVVIGIVVAFLVIVAAIVVGIFIHQKIEDNKKKKAEKKQEQVEAEYMDNYGSAVYKMLSGASEAESVCGLIHDVWYDAIYDKYSDRSYKYTKGTSDFNDALANLFSDSSFKSKVSSIEDNQSEVDRLMKELKNPPDVYDDAYDALKDLYECYSKLTNMAVNPTGSLSSYTSDFNSVDSDFLSKYNKAKLYVE